MAKKNILVSNNNGKYQPISASIDSDTGEISSSLPLTLNTASFIGQSGLMQIFNGILTPVLNSSSVNSTPDGNTYSGSILTYNSLEGFGPHRKEAAAFTGDISGYLTTGIKVRSITNVTSGILPVAYGGTGQTSFVSGSIITTSGSGPVYGQSNKCVIYDGSELILADNNLVQFTPMTGAIAYLYTGSYGITGTFTWTKPAGCRFVQVVCQGGGGSTGNSSVSSGNGSSGGGGGGLSIVTLNALTLPQAVTVTAGSGGAGSTTPGAEYGTNTARASNPGGNSYFGSYIMAYGGGLSPTRATPGAGGIGYTANGGAGGVGGQSLYQEAGSPSPTSYGPSGGGGGASATSGYARYGGTGGATTYRNLTPAYNSVYGNGANGNTAPYIKINNVFINDQPATSLPNLVQGGGGGAGYSGAGTPTNVIPGGAEFGAGAGGRVSTTGGHRSGGKGYVLIICY